MLARTNLLSLVKEHRFFSGLESIEQHQLLKLINPLDLKNKNLSHCIIKDCVFFVLKGNISFNFKNNKEKTYSARTVLSGHDIINNYSDKDITLTPSSDAKIYILRISDLKNQMHFFHIYEIIAQNLGIESTENFESVTDLKKLIRFYRNELGHRLLCTQVFIITIISLLCLYIVSLQFIESSISQKGNAIFVTFIFTLISTVILFIALRITNLPPAAIGFTFTNTRIAVIEGILLTIPGILVMIIFKWILILTVPAFHHLSIFDIHADINGLGGTRHFLLALIEYPILSVTLQEIVFRSGIQGFMQYIYADNKTMVIPIVGTSIIFATMHIMMSPIAPLLIFIPSLFWGWLFAKHHNLIGVCISHSLFGIVGFFFMGIFQLIRAF
jgi:membrane protease YdiL (CAAX protease family)